MSRAYINGELIFFFLLNQHHHNSKKNKIISLNSNLYRLKINLKNLLFKNQRLLKKKLKIIMSNDEAIQLTNNDATNFKAYAVSKGYWSDSYLPHFSPAAFKQPQQQPQQQQQPIEHKPPEMSRGYFARVNAIRSVVFRFLEAKGPNCQIVNLGCGFDTLYFELSDHHLAPKKFVELDFNRVVMSKIRIIKSKKALSDKVWKPAANTQPPQATPIAASSSTTTTPADPFKLPSLPAPSFHPGPSNEIRFVISC